MVSKRLIGMTVGITAMAMCEARADWIDYIADPGASVGLDWAKGVAKFVDKNPLAGKQIGPMGDLLSFTRAIPEAVKRQQDYNLGLGQTISEQEWITGSGFVFGKAVGDFALTICVTAAG